MRYLKVTNFPKPTVYDEFLQISSGGVFINSAVFLASLLLMGFSICLGANTLLNWDWWQWFLMAFLFAVPSLIGHEFFHLIAHPKFGFNEESKFGCGIVSRVLVLWVGYAGWVTRSRAVVINLLPLGVLVVATSIVGFFVGGELGGYLYFIAGVNLIASRQDVLNSYFLIRSELVEVYEASGGHYGRRMSK